MKNHDPSSPLAPEVMVFRQFRDDFLLTSKMGTALVNLYYLVSLAFSAFDLERTNLKNYSTKLVAQSSGTIAQQDAKVLTMG